MAKAGKVLVGGAKGTPNPGGNSDIALKREPNGKGIGDLPGMNQPYMDEAKENTDPMMKHEKVGKIVGE